MTLVGRLSEIGIHKALRVYRCLPCQRIATSHDWGKGWQTGPACPGVSAARRWRASVRAPRASGEAARLLSWPN